jgi:hypothetical protein
LHGFVDGSLRQERCADGKDDGTDSDAFDWAGRRGGGAWVSIGVRAAEATNADAAWYRAAEP